MKKFITVLLLLVLVCSTVFCVAEDDDEAGARFEEIVGNLTEIKGMTDTVMERIKEYNERIDNGEELTDVDVLTYISYLKLYVSLKEVETMELYGVNSGINKSMRDSLASIDNIIETLDTEGRLLMAGKLTKDVIAVAIRGMAEGIGKEE